MLAGCLQAQVARLANVSPLAFDGWVRTTVDIRPRFAAGALPDGTRYVLGSQVGLDVWAIDVHAHLAPTERRTIDLAAATETARPPVMPPSDPIAFFGGWVSANGRPLWISSVEVDGASILCHVHGRVSPMLHVDAWLRWYPDQPGMVTGEALTTCSNGSVPDVLASAPDGVRLQFGDGLAYVIGAGWSDLVVPAGTDFADGQARAVPVVFLWPQRILGADQFAQAAAAVQRSLGAVGIAKLWPHGSPTYPPDFNAAAWPLSQAFGEGSTLWEAAKRRLHTWEPGVIGPNTNSGDTGAQWDQVFVGGEPMLPGGVGNEQLVYLSALKLAARPCHHLEADGRQADPVDHPNCVFWSGRPHWHTGVSPDQLGKTQGITIEQTHGWMGPDREHWLYNTVAAASRMVDSPALQHELAQQARLFLFGETVRPGYSTSGPDAARSIGWAGIMAVHLWRGLEDRGLAARLRARYEDRVRLVYVPITGASALDIWDVRTDSGFGVGKAWAAWQQSIGAYGLWLAGDVFGLDDAKAIALRGAKACLAYNWIKQGDRYHGVGNIAFPPPTDTAYLGRTWPAPWFETTWDLPALWVVLQAEPGNAKARAVWSQALADLGSARRSWVPPGEIPPAPTEPPTSAATTVSQWGVTWTFAQPRPVGQFCNGDWWVVGPVTVTAIAPGRQTQPDGRVTGGSMLNPLPRADGRQGYDSKLYDPFLGDETGSPRWRPEMGVALPLTITTGSLISTTPQIGSAGTQLSALRTAAVLTVLDAVPPPDAFRPPYAGTDKTVRYRATDILAALPSLTAAPGAPSVDSVLAPFRASLFLDHFPNWTSRYMHPTAGLGDYYQTFTAQIGTAALLACSDIPDDKKLECAIVVAQLGIDNYEHMRLGSIWGVNGHCNGRKFPILFAGKVLGDPAMLAAGVTWQPTQGSRTGEAIDATQPVRVPFSEDGQTFYVRETSPGVINWGHGGYTAAHVGLPEWGNFHLGNPSGDYVAWHREGQNNYRRCCSAISWSGVTLAMRALGLRDAWNQPAFFDYVDRYLQTETTDLRGDAWQVAMWDMHRGAL